MTSENDKKISTLTIRLTDTNSLLTIGTGILYSQKNLGDWIYIITAAHCLFSDGDSFQNMLSEINVDLYDAKTNSYKTMTCQVQEKLLFKDKDKDLAILCIAKHKIEKLIGTPPSVYIIKERHNFHNLVVKGFPNATEGKELAVINPIWKQNMTEVNKFQLQLTDDYTEWATKGFSGSGIFLEANGEIYLYGIFTRFRPEDKGRVIYCQFIESLNELLDSNYLPLITFSYLGDYGLTENYFQKHIEMSIENLGDRYDKKINFKLPIAQRFSDIAKDKNLKQKLFKIVDNWLSDRGWRQLKDNNEIGEIETQLSELQDGVKTWIENLDFARNNKIELDWIDEEITVINNHIDITIRKLYDKQTEEESKNRNTKKDYSYKTPYENEIERLREIKSRNYRFTNSLSSNINIQLVNNPVMIIHGEAGSGKSHLLGDIAKNRIERNAPTILLLGQLFQNGDTVEKNILTQLDLNCNFESFLIACNDIGKQIGSRLLILIDAINESTGASELWNRQLAGFITQVEKHPFIGLVITIRDTYYDDIIPPSITKNEKITFLSHEGFSGNEYEALRLFCNHYQLEQPKFPILTPEFSKPLFLKLVCEAISQSDNKVFPSGFQGINRIFDLYLESLNKVFLRKPQYKFRSKLIREVIQKLANFCFIKNKRQLLIEDAVTFFDDNFAQFPTLLSDLIQEGVFTKNLKRVYDSDKKEEVIYFTYEKLGDYHVATELLKKYSTSEEIRMACQKDNDLGILLKNYVNNGIIEALTVLLPENHQIEIFEVFEWLFTEKQNYLNSSFYSDPQLLNHYLLESFKWRTPQSIDTEKISNWLCSDSFQVEDDNYLFTLLELTTVENHPFNSDRLFKILIDYSMPKRDSFWQEHIKKFSGYGDENQAFPIRRLIEWAWIPNISSQTSVESSRLAGQTLAWVLSSTCTVLRDETTKAMVNLLEQQPDSLISILDKFKTIDDLYILERLYAVAYGCTLRTEKDDSIQKIAQFTYDTIFKSGTPIPHILLRDYARNIIEYAIYKKLDVIELNEKLIRPPYKSTFPLLPSEQDIQKYYLKHESEEFKKKRYGGLHNYVYFSVMEWDFGRKIIEPQIDYFSPDNFKFEGIYKEWLKRFTRKQKETIKYFISSNESKESLKDCKDLFIRMNDEQSFNKFLKGCDDIIFHYDNLVENQFNEVDKQFIRNEAIPHFIFKIKLENDKGHNYRLNSEPIKRWIVQRVFELGYDVELHGYYDSTYTKYSNRSFYNDTERVSKKYQWIAYYEILAFLTDQHKVGGFWGSRDKYNYYKGTWQMFLRDIDPIMTTQNITDKNDSEKELILLSHNEKSWWSEKEYEFWNDSKVNSEWIINIDDLPKPKDYILKYDNDGNEWVSLEQHTTWYEPKSLGQDKHSSYTKNIHYSLNSYIVKKKDKLKIAEFLQTKNLWSLHLPKNKQDGSGLMNREKFWSPAYLDQEKEVKWEQIPSTPYKVIISTTNAKGLIEGDKSGTIARYNIPCKTLFEALCLQYAPTDGDFKDKTGEIIVKAINPEGVIIRKDKLFEYLKANDLDIIWTISGEKIAKEEGYKGNREYYHGGQPCGVFYFNENSLSGQLKMYKRI